MTEYAICFDFPEMNGEPWFATMTNEGLFALTPWFARAHRFDSEDAAERTLANDYGGETKSFGAVVEIGQ